MDDKMHLFILAAASTFIVLMAWDYVATHYAPSLPVV